MNNVIKLHILLLPIVAVMLIASGSDDSSGPISSGGQLTLTLALLDPNTMTLTSNFNCIDCPIYENGLLYLKITTTSNSPYAFAVSPSNCYKSGGNIFLYGDVWSNTLCTP